MPSSKLHLGVTIGEDSDVGDFVVIGVPPRGTQEGELPTTIGSHATIRSHTVIYAGNTIGRSFQTGHGVMIREENQIGNNVSVGTHSVIEHHVVIGDNVRIHSNAFVPEYCVLADGCWIGPGVVLTNAPYPTSALAKAKLRGVTVQEGAVVGAGAIILPGVTIGRNAVIGAGAVVVSDVEENAVVIGSPQRFLKWRHEIADYNEAVE